jgi:PAS domain S-box-containing protein
VVWVCRPDGATEYVNRRGLEFLGVDAASTSDMRWLRFVHPEDQQEASAAWLNTVHFESPYEATHRVLGSDGAYRWMVAQADALRDDGGAVERWIGTWTDVDEIKGLEEGLRVAQQFRAVVMDNMAEGLVTTDANGRLTYLNRSATKMLGWTLAELSGQGIHDTVHFQDRAGVPIPRESCPLHGVLTLGRTVRLDAEAFTHKDGSIFPVAIGAAPLRTDSAVNGMVIVFRDVTEHEREREHVSAQSQLDKLTWVGRIRDALDEDRFQLFSQPIVPLAGGRPGEELLLRMIGRSGEVVPPARFLRVAEKYGLIGEIDRWVTTEAIRLAGRGLNVAVNLSAHSIRSLDLLSLIEREVGATGADPSNLVFEITETALIDNLGAAEVFARGLATLGCGLALDDFGTGYGSLNVVKRLALNYLKIDIEFVRDLAESTENQYVVRAIVGLARAFGLQTIAEGVEDEATLNLLGKEGVDFAQGFHVGLPASLPTLDAP